jgi:DNA topoisomerase II
MYAHVYFHTHTPVPAQHPPHPHTSHPKQDFKERHTDSSVYFIITLSEKDAPELLVDDAALLKRLKLEASLSTSNMHLFNAEGQITKYDSPLDVLQEYYPYRLDLYEKRRAALLERMDREWRRLDNKVRAWALWAVERGGGG